MRMRVDLQNIHLGKSFLTRNSWRFSARALQAHTVVVKVLTSG